MQKRYSYLTDKTTDKQWQTTFVNYLLKGNIFDSFYWSINSESSDTYGIYTTPYDPVSNTSGWGTWSGTDSRKLDLLKKLWNATPQGVLSKKGAAGTATVFRVSSSGLITYIVPKAGFVSLKLYNVNGRLQSEIIGKRQEVGAYSVNGGQKAGAAGSYLAIFRAGDYVQKQMVNFVN